MRLSPPCEPIGVRGGYPPADYRVRRLAPDDCREHSEYKYPDCSGSTIDAHRTTSRLCLRAGLYQLSADAVRQLLKRTSAMDRFSTVCILLCALLPAIWAWPISRWPPWADAEPLDSQRVMVRRDGSRAELLRELALAAERASAESSQQVLRNLASNLRARDGQRVQIDRNCFMSPVQCLLPRDRINF
uniref:Uncharacterized protein n=1 Tax=Plectus sambesii TaxID=2011161 RepID=A0A914VZ99_9BILA